MTADVDLAVPLPGLFTVDQAAAYLGVSAQTVRAEIQRRRLAACRVGRQIRITDDQLRAYLGGKP